MENKKIEEKHNNSKNLTDVLLILFAIILLFALMITASIGMYDNMKPSGTPPVEKEPPKKEEPVAEYTSKTYNPTTGVYTVMFASRRKGNLKELYKYLSTLDNAEIIEIVSSGGLSASSYILIYRIIDSKE